MPALPLDLTTILLIFAIVLITLLYLREYNLRKKLQSEGEKFLEKLKEKGWDTLRKSIQKSQDLLGQAELEGIKVVAGSTIETSHFIDASKQTIVSAQNQLLQFMADLQKRSEQFEEASKQAGQQRINQLFDRVEQRLTDFLVQTEQKTTSSIELELKSARALIETYKNEQLKLIDENIVAMMEQTLGVVLGKKLSLKDQLDLIYEALEKAKVEKFIV